MTTQNETASSLDDKQFKEEVKKQSKELFELLLKKTGVKKQDIIEMATREFIKENLGMLTTAERQQFDCLAL